MNQNKLYRIFKLVELLSHKPRTINTISRYLDVTERTVYRYFDLFRKLGHTIERQKFNKYLLIKK